MFAVIFEVHPHTERWRDDLDHASLLRPELLKIDGFIGNERRADRGLTFRTDQPAAEAALSSLSGSRRMDRIIPQYGMFEREEAPQYDPPACLIQMA